MTFFNIGAVGVSTVLFVGLLSACVQLGATETDTKVETDIPVKMENFVQCSTPRPEICYEIYQPVCATRDTGVRCVTTPCPSTEVATYSNDCKACADPKVMGFTEHGACKGAELSVDLSKRIGG